MNALRGPRKLVVAAWLAAMAHGSVAHADPTQERTGLGAFEEGRRLFEAKKYEDALRAFRASNDAMPSPNSRLYVARCQRALGKTASAYSTFRLASREAEDRVRATGDKRYAATQQSAALEAARLEPLVPRVTLVLARPFDAEAERAVLKVDGDEVPRAAWATSLELDPGPHTFVLSGPHLERTEASVSLAERDVKELTLPVKRLRFGTLKLTFRTRPTGLAVEIDEAPVDLAAERASREVTAGAHTLVAHAPGYATLRWQGEVGDQGSTDVPIDLVPLSPVAPDRPASAASGTPRWLFFTAAGAAIVTAGAGAYLLLDARGTDDAEQQKPLAERDATVRDDVRERAQLGSALLLAGGGLAVVAGVLGFTTRWKPARTGLTLAPQLTAGRAALAGEF
jgi:hypothetical protein